MSRHHRNARWAGRPVTELRIQWGARIAEGAVACGLCGQTITPGQAWDLGHRLALAEGGDENDVRPEHALKADCAEGGNRSAGARLGNQQRRQRVRKWL